MDTQPFPVLQALCLHILSLSQDKRNEAYLSVMADCPETDIRQALNALSQKKLVHFTPESAVWHCIADTKTRNLAAQALRTGYAQGTIEYYLGFLIDDLGVEYSDQYLAFLDNAIKSGNKRVELSLELTICYFLVAAKHPGLDKPAMGKKFIEMSLLLQAVSTAMELYVDLALCLASCCYEVALRLNFCPETSYFDMSKSFTDYFFSEGAISKRLFSFLEALSKSLERPGHNKKQADNSKAPDKETVPAESILDQIELSLYGNLRNSFKQENFSERLLHLVATSLSHNAMHTRQYSLSESIIGAATAKRDRTQSKTTTNLWLVHHCFVLMRQGKCDEALEQLDMLFHTSPYNDKNQLVAASVIRGLSLYHYFHKRIDYAHTIMSRETQVLMDRGVSHRDFVDPLIFDMLYSFELMGYPPVPRYELDRIIPQIFLSSNHLLQGAALRIQALRLRNKGGNPEKIIALLQQSKEKLHPERDIPNRSLTTHELANTLALCGRYEEISALREQVAKQTGYWLDADTPYRIMVLLAIGINTGLPDLQNYTSRPYDGPGKIPGPSALRRELDILTYCHKTFQDISLRDDLHDLLVQIVKMLHTALQCTHIAVFQPNPAGEYVCVAKAGEDAGKNHDCLGKACTEWMHQDKKLPGPTFFQSPENDIYLSIQTSAIRPWAVCLSFPPDNILKKIDPINLQIMLQSIATEIRFAITLHQIEHSKITQRERIKKTPQLQESRAATEFIIGQGLTSQITLLEQAAPTPAPILLYGKTGVGKELIAKHVHLASGRLGPFIAVNPSNTSAYLFESEFFGHERGAFTGAASQRIGYVEAAHEGTLFIDEIGDTPMPMQTKLLRVLQEQSFMRVGSSRHIHSDFRLITATNKNLWEAVEQGTFRKDLFYRIAVLPVTVPALRDRPQDIRQLATKFLGHFAKLYNRASPTLTQAQWDALESHSWPGNVRELRNIAERTVIQGSFASPESVFAGMAKELPVTTHSGLANLFKDTPTLDELERLYLQHIMQKTEGRVRGKGGSAELLRLKTSTLYAKLKKYNL